MKLALGKHFHEGFNRQSPFAWWGGRARQSRAPLGGGPAEDSLHEPIGSDPPVGTAPPPSCPTFPLIFLTQPSVSGSVPSQGQARVGMKV